MTTPKGYIMCIKDKIKITPLQGDEKKTAGENSQPVSCSDTGSWPCLLKSGSLIFTESDKNKTSYKTSKWQ